jgi:hypothetical protein
MGLHSRLASLRTALVSRVAVDARALAAFRIGLGTLLLVDLLRRSRDLVAFHADAGVLPRTTPHPRVQRWLDLSIHALSGEAWVQALLVVLAGIAAVALLVGYRTKTATLLSFLLLVSIQARNPLILNAGDTLFRRLLFWSLFLPLGARWSVDATRSERFRDRIAGWATAALLLQVVLVYAVNVVLKFEGSLWTRGLAVRYVFELDSFTVLLGDSLAEFPALLALADWIWLVALLCSPLLLVFRGSGRAAVAALLATMHLGMALTMQIGIFPLVSVVSLVPFLPPAIWDRLPSPSWELTRRIERRCPRLPRRPDLRARIRPLGSAVAAVLFAVLLVVNAVALGFVPAPEGTPEQVTDPSWSMFAPRPPTADAWFRAPATLDSGERIDALGQSSLSWDRPPDPSATYPNERWRKYLWRLAGNDGTPLREPFAQYLCERWNGAHADDIERLRLVVVREPTTLDRPESTERVGLGAFDCATGDDPVTAR